jgi:hypothetical protein
MPFVLISNNRSGTQFSKYLTRRSSSKQFRFLPFFLAFFLLLFPSVVLLIAHSSFFIVRLFGWVVLKRNLRNCRTKSYGGPNEINNSVSTTATISVEYK